MQQITVNIPTPSQYTVVIRMPISANVNIVYEYVSDEYDEFPLKEPVKNMGYSYDDSISVSSTSTVGSSVSHSMNSNVSNNTFNSRINNFYNVEHDYVPVRSTVGTSGKVNSNVGIKTTSSTTCTASTSSASSSSTSVLPATLPSQYIKGSGRPTNTKRHYFTAGGDLFRIKDSKVDMLKTRGIITSAHNYYNEKIGNWYLVYTAEFENGSSQCIIAYDSNDTLILGKDNKVDIEHIKKYYIALPVYHLDSKLEYMGPGCLKVGDYYCKFN